MHVIKLVVMVAALLLALPAEGLLAIPTRQQKVVHILPTIKKKNNIIYHRRNNILRSSTASLEYPSSSLIENISVERSYSLNRVQSKIVHILMISYIISMCFALPLTLFPVYLLYKAKLIGRVRKEMWSLKVGQFTARWLMRIFPFASKSVVVDADDEQLKTPQPSIWVCNHISMLDLFFVLALDNKMRGKARRPIKILYWKGLEANPITCLLCKMCGFIPVDMADNGNGNANEYDVKSFKEMLKRTKAAIDEGFDIGILPEGQPNPTPEKGMQPIFSGAYTLAKMSRRPIKMISLYGLNRMWHPDGGMPCISRKMSVRVYPNGRVYTDAEEFSSTFSTVAGYFGAHGKDLPQEELNMWLDGSMWQTELSRREATRMAAEDIEDEETKDEGLKNETKEQPMQ